MDNNSNSSLAPVIYVAESPEQVRNYKWDSRAQSLNKNVVLLVPDQIRKLKEGREFFYLPYDLTPGDVLLRHPYNQGYIQAAEAKDEYLKASAEGIFLVARCLGATKISYLKCNIAEFKRETDSDNGLKYKSVDLKLDVKNSMEHQLLEKIKMTREFPRQEFTIDQYNKAKMIAEERGLLISREIRNLLDDRNPELGKPMSHQAVNIEISSSLNKSLDIAFTLNYVSFLKLNSNTKIATEEKLVLNIEWDITF